MKTLWRGTKKLFRLSLLAFLCCTRSKAGEYSVTTWGVDEGLPQSSVTDIAQTPDGFLWVGTLLSGLSCFDGFKFVNFDSANTPELANPGIRRLQVDSRGNLWVSVVGNILLEKTGNRFTKVGEGFQIASLVGDDDNRIIFSTIEGGLAVGTHDVAGNWNWAQFKRPVPSANTHFVEDAKGVVWFQVPGSRIGRFADNKFEIMESTPGLTGKKIQTLARDDDGQIWVGTETELARWDGEAFTNCNAGGLIVKISVRRIIPSVKGRLWIEADGKLRLYDHGKWHEPLNDWDGNQVPWSHVRSVRVDFHGGFWASLTEEGLAHVSAEGKVTRITSSDGLPSQLVQAFFASRDGNLWAGYHRGGLVALRKETFHSVGQREGVLDTLVTSITEDTNGAIWMGTAGGSVVRWADGICQNFSLPLKGEFCQDVVVCSGMDGRVWVGTVGNGLLVSDNGGFKHVLTPEVLPQGVRQMVVSRDGDVWFANLGGLYRMDGNKQIRVMETTTYSRAVAALAEGTNGSIWVGTIDGTLKAWRNGVWSTYQPASDIPPSRFWSMLAENDGTIWVGTFSSGLLKFKDGLFSRFTMKDGLADDSISHILDDNLGNLWLASRSGVMCVAKSSLRESLSTTNQTRCRLFGRSDGLPTVAFTLEFQPGCVRSGDGALWFGTPKGASWVSPKNLREIQAPPVVSIESIFTDGNERKPGEQGIAGGTSKIVLEPSAKYLEVRFSSPVFTAPDLLHFSYILDPVDPAWIDVGSRRAVTFNHLPAGNYTFRVKAMNSDGLWSQREALFKLEVESYFWQRRSFVVTMISLLLALVAMIARGITNHRMRRKLESLRQQQQIERERARIAQDLHDDLGAGLTEISLTSDLAENPSMPEHESRQYTREIGARARELVQRMDEIVWAVNPRNDSIKSLSVYACQYAQHQLKPLDIACRLDVQPDLPEVPLNAEQRYNFFLAFKEVVTNVARHSKATELNLSIHTEGKRLCFVIEDNGRGFEAGTSLEGADGLRNIQERIARMGGESEIKSNLGKGTSVALKLPLDSAKENGATSR